MNVSLGTPEEMGSCAKHGSFEIKTINLGFKLTKLDQCPQCMQAEVNAKKVKEEEKAHAERQAKIEARLEQAGIPALLRDRSFANYQVKTAAQERAWERFHSFAASFRSHLKTGTVVVGAGRRGTGKTHLACAVANDVMSRGYTAYFTSITRLFTKIRSTWAKSSEMTEEQMLKQFEQIDLMIIDEIGVQRGTADEERTLHELLEARRLNCKPTILLTNAGPKELKTYLGERFWDRLDESGVSVVFDWESHRRQSRDVGGLDAEAA